MRRVGATTSSSRRSRGFELTQSLAPAPVVQSSAALAPRTGAIALARLRDLALLPALVVLLIIGSLISPVFLTSGSIKTILTSSAALALVVLAESLVIITGKFDLSLESIYGIAPAIGAMVVLPAEVFGFGFDGRRRSAFSRCWSWVARSALSTASWW